jgi:hypothetical protein
VHSRKGTKRFTTKQSGAFDFVVSWLSNRCATKPQHGKTCYVLPGVTHWKDYYALYVASAPEPHFKAPHFGSFLQDHFPDLVLDARHNLPECTICTTINRYLKRSDVEVNQLAVARYMRESHYQLQHSELLAFHGLEALAMQPLQEYVLVEVDGSDSRPLPHYAPSVQRAAFDTHLIGVRVVCGAYEREAIYVHFPEVWRMASTERKRTAAAAAAKPKGCDTVLTVLMLELQLLFLLVRARWLLVRTDNTVCAVQSEIGSHLYRHRSTRISTWCTFCRTSSCAKWWRA